MWTQMNDKMKFKPGGFNRKTVQLFLLIQVYKFALDFGFWKILVESRPYYTEDFNIMKFIIGEICIIITFAFMKHDSQKASSFFLTFIYVMQILPITTIYAAQNASTTYYFLTWFFFLICICIVRWTKPLPDIKTVFPISKIMLCIFGLTVLILLVYIFLRNGFPSLIALNIYDVYKLRAGGIQISKYMNYLLFWANSVFLPILLVKSLLEKRYFRAFSAISVLFLFYLYLGHKTFLFYILFCIFISSWSRKEECYFSFFRMFSICVIFLTLLAVIPGPQQNIFIEMYALLVRRVLIVPADLKFIHYDYFLSHEHLLLYGAIPRILLLHSPAEYMVNGYTYDIGEIYFNSPNMSAGTGAFAEGFSRFGYPGMLLVFLIIAIILKLIDRFQDRTTYSIAISFYLCAIYSLAEAPLISSIIIGPWMFYMLLLVFYKPEKRIVVNSQKCRRNLGRKKNGQGSRYSL